jgi:hypothetical protein
VTARALRVACLAAALLMGAHPAAAGVRDSSPPAAAPQAPEGWLARLNRYRAAACLPAVFESPALSAGAGKHATYIVKNRSASHREDPGNDWFTPEGHAAAQQCNVALGLGVDDTDGWAIDLWMQSPFHAVGVLDPALASVGYGSCREADDDPLAGAALNVRAGVREPAGAAYPLFWPGDGATVPLTDHRAEYPSPLASCPGYAPPSGLPLILQVGPGSLTPVVAATSFTRDGRPLEHCVFDETTYRNPDGVQQKLGRDILAARDAIVLVPRHPLAPGATYTASIAVDGRTHSWSFTVGSSLQAREATSPPGPITRAE